jgi:hypothetical protein
VKRRIFMGECPGLGQIYGLLGKGSKISDRIIHPLILTELFSQLQLSSSKKGRKKTIGQRTDRRKHGLMDVIREHIFFTRLSGTGQIYKKCVHILKTGDFGCFITKDLT